MQFSLEEFGDVLAVRNAAGKPYVILGGQAVNYWATRYLSSEPDLAAWQPFTSKDIDFRGDRGDVRRMAMALQRTPLFPPTRMLTAFAGAVPWAVGAEPTRIEFVRQVPGTTAREIETLAVEHAYLGKRARVIDPVSLLGCKLDLALTVNQSQRRDAEHAQILFLCVRAFLREGLRGVEAGELPVRGWLGVVERLLKLAESRSGSRASGKLAIHWPDILPHRDISACTGAQVVQFREKRLAVWTTKLGKRRKMGRA